VKLYDAGPLKLRVRNREARVRWGSRVLAVITLLALAPLGGIDASAQAPVVAPPEWPATVGTRVRATLPTQRSTAIAVVDEGSLVTGTIAALAPDTLYVRPHPATGVVAIPRAAVRGLAVSRGRSRTRTALKFGFNGLLLGVAGSAMLHGPLTGARGMPPASEIARAGAVGASLGAWIGAWLPREDWRGLPLAPNPERP
jgi:hypothetical protein